MVTSLWVRVVTWSLIGLSEFGESAKLLISMSRDVIVSRSHNKIFDKISELVWL